MTSKIGTAWKWIKRVVAHSFELRTRDELEVMNRLRQDRERTKKAQEIRQKYFDDLAFHLEMKAKIKAWEDEQKRLEQEEQAREEERVRLYLDNREKQDRLIYKQDDNQDDKKL